MNVEFDKVSTRDAFGNALAELARENENILYVAADTLKSVGGTKMHNEFPDRAINIGIAEHENGLPESSRGIMAAVAVQTNESVLAELIQAVSVRPNPYTALVMARSISATIMTVTEKPVILNKLAEFMDVDISDKHQLEMALHDYFMRAIEANVSLNPWQK